jgi:hypothetical protein
MLNLMSNLSKLANDGQISKKDDKSINHGETSWLIQN